MGDIFRGLEGAFKSLKEMTSMMSIKTLWLCEV